MGIKKPLSADVYLLPISLLMILHPRMSNCYIFAIIYNLGDLYYLLEYEIIIMLFPYIFETIQWLFSSMI